MISLRIIQQLAVLTLFAVVLAGCSPKTPAQKSVVQLGADMQQAGVMSQKDYVRVVDLQHKTSKTHQISDEDFAWTLSLLKTADNSVARARAMTALSDIRPMNSAQKAETTSAIAPYLNSTDPLDAASAKRVQTAIQKN